MTNSDAARELIANALNVSMNAITEDSTLGNVENWDSLGHMRILMEIEARLGRELDAEEAVGVQDVKSVGKLLAKR